MDKNTYWICKTFQFEIHDTNKAKDSQNESYNTKISIIVTTSIGLFVI